jgi:hypothetical protein
MSDKYILDERHAVIPADLLTWARWFETADAQRVVAQEMLGAVKVSTVFLGLDHQYGMGPPLLFETMVFGGGLDGHQTRYSTWEEAVAGHRAMVERARTAR